MDVLVTGARGSQQSPIVDELVARGHEVTALSRELRENRPGVRWVRGRLDDIDGFADDIERIDALAFHRPVSTQPWPVEPLIRAARKWGVERVIFNASSAVPPGGTPNSDSRDVVDALDRSGMATAIERFDCPLPASG